MEPCGGGSLVGIAEMVGQPLNEHPRDGGHEPRGGPLDGNPRDCGRLAVRLVGGIPDKEHHRRGGPLCRHPRNDGQHPRGGPLCRRPRDFDTPLGPLDGTPVMMGTDLAADRSTSIPVLAPAELKSPTCVGGPRAKHLRVRGHRPRTRPRYRHLRDARHAPR